MTTKTYNLPGVIKGIDTINKIFSKFRYYRSKIKLEFRLTTTVYHQGSLMISWLPQVDTTMTVPDIFTLSGCNAHILSASTKDNLSLEVPYCGSADWIDILGPCNGPSAAVDSRQATVYIAELNRLLSTSPNISASVPICVYVSFTEIEVSGFSSHSGESRKKNKDGVDAKTPVKAVSQMVRQAPVVGPIWGTIADILNSFAGDLAKPVTEEAPKPITLVPTPDLATCHGLTQADEVSMYHGALVSQTKMFCGMLTSHMTLNELARKPMLHAQFTFDGTNTAFSLYATPQYKSYSDFRNVDWLWAISYAFSYWRGSIKYLIHFVLPSFQSFKAQLVLADQIGDTIISSGDLINKVVDVAGETWVEVEVPYQRVTQWTDPYAESQATVGYVPQLNIIQLTPIVGSSLPATPVCYVNVFRAGGEDTAFRCLQHASYGLGHAPIFEGQSHCSLEQKFTKPFPGIMDGVQQSMEKGFVAPEIAATVSDCLKRGSFTITQSTFTSYDITAPFTFPAGTTNRNYESCGLEPYQYFAAMFAFWRGSRIMRHLPATKYWGVEGATTTLSIGDGAAAYYPSSAGTLQFREALSVDYRSMFPFVPVGQPGYKIDVNNYTIVATGASYNYPLQKILTCNGNDLSTITQLAISGGDDFMLIHPVPFFPIKFYPTVTRDSPSSFKAVTIPESTREGIAEAAGMAAFRNPNTTTPTVDAVGAYFKAKKNS